MVIHFALSSSLNTEEVAETESAKIMNIRPEDDQIILALTAAVAHSKNLILSFSKC